MSTTSVGKSNRNELKLASILAAAAGMHQASQEAEGLEAYYHQYASPVLVGRNGSLTIQNPTLSLTLQGSAQANVMAIATPTPNKFTGMLTGAFLGVRKYDRAFTTQPGKTLPGAARIVAYGVKWDGVPDYSGQFGNLLRSDTLNILGPTVTAKRGYLLFYFEDTTTIPEGERRYGWIDIELNSYISGGNPYMNVKVYAYAWGGVNVMIPAGQNPVPEPSSLAMAGLAALATGAAGLRRWRQARQSGSASRFERNSITA